MKQIILTILYIISIGVYAQDEKTVTLVVSGQGKTQDEAKLNTLRSAIEQAFGTFISSKTEILNDKLVIDEIVSVTNGNIQKYETVSEVKLPDGTYATTLKATVSVSKLTSFCESKGVEVEFKGSLFTFNINQQKINEDNEAKAVKNIIEVTKKILKQSFLAKINLKEPLVYDKVNYELPIDIDIVADTNINLATEFFFRSINNLCMKQVEIENYKKLNKAVYYLAFLKCEKPINGELKYYLRESTSYYTKGYSDRQASLDDFLQSTKEKVLVIDPKDNNRNYSYCNIILRNEESEALIRKFIRDSYNYALDFSILNQNKEKILIDIYFKVGTLPFAEYGDQKEFFIKNYKTYSYSWQTRFQNLYYKKNINRHLEGFIFVQFYSQSALIWKIKAKSRLTLHQLKSISSLNLKYN